MTFTTPRRDLEERILSSIDSIAVLSPHLPLILLALSLIVHTHITAQAPKGRAPHRQDRILVQPKLGQALSKIEDLHRRLGTAAISKFPFVGGLQVVRVPPGISPERLAVRYLESDLAEFAEPDYVVSAHVTPNDPYFTNGTLWGLNNSGQNGGTVNADIGAPEAWNAINDAQDVIVAVIDSGVRYTHEDLADNMWINPLEIPGNGKDDDRNQFIDDIHGINPYSNNGDPTDDLGHGTHVAGTIGAIGNNGKGIVGVAWNVRIMALRFMDHNGEGALSDAIQCIDYAVAHGADIINASWGGPGHSLALQRSLQAAQQEGIIIAAAAGNEASNIDFTPLYPASYTLNNIVSVAATTRTDQLANYSNFGAISVDLAAPGSSIFSCSAAGDRSYTFSSGTSMATPHVAGALALLKARFPNDDYERLIQRLYDAVDPLPALQGVSRTKGRLNINSVFDQGLDADFTLTPDSGGAPLMVTFTDRSVGTIAQWHWDFGDQSPASGEQNPTHLYQTAGNYEITLTATDFEGATSVKSKQISVVSNYIITTGNEAWIEPTGMTALSLSDDGVSSAQTIPFNFEYYGQSYDRLYVGANGLIGFDPNGLNQKSNSILPSTATPNAIVAPYWDDLNPAKGGTVYIGTTGNAPNRKLVVSWVNLRHGATGRPLSLTFQISLEETTGRIAFHYRNVASSDSRGGGKLATVGIENQVGNTAAMVSFNGNQVLQDGRSLVFTPTATASMEVESPDKLIYSGGTGGPFASENPSLNITNGGSAELNWSAAIDSSWFQLTAAEGVLAPGASSTSTVRFVSDAIDLLAGIYHGTLTVKNESNGFGNTVIPLELQVNGTTPILSVFPDSDFHVTGEIGGPFTLASKVYTLQNAGDATLDWTLITDVDWLELSTSTGSLTPDETSTLMVILASGVNSFEPGEYQATIQFANLVNGFGDATRNVRVTVQESPGILFVSPQTGFQPSGPVGGPFSPEQQSYRLTNDGGQDLTWLAMTSLEWIELSPTFGTLAPGGTTDLLVSLNSTVDQLPIGVFEDALTILNLDNPDSSAARDIRLTISETTGQLVLDGAPALFVTGPEGGPFSPEANPFVITNPGGSSIDWVATSSEAWITLSPANGTLEPASDSAVIATVNETADFLQPGSHLAIVDFSIVGNPTPSISAPVILEVSPNVRLAISPTDSTSQTTLLLSADPGQTFVILSSPDLVSWTAFRTVTADESGLAELSIALEGIANGLFFRAVIQTF